MCIRDSPTPRNDAEDGEPEATSQLALRAEVGHKARERELRVGKLHNDVIVCPVCQVQLAAGRHQTLLLGIGRIVLGLGHLKGQVVKSFVHRLQFYIHRLRTVYETVVHRTAPLH